MLEDGHDCRKRWPFTIQIYKCIFNHWLWLMWNSTVNQLFMEEIHCKTRQEIGRNHLQRMFPPVQEATEGTFHPQKHLRLDNEQVDNQNDPPLWTNPPIQEIIRTDKLEIVSELPPPPYLILHQYLPLIWVHPKDQMVNLLLSTSRSSKTTIKWKISTRQESIKEKNPRIIWKTMRNLTIIMTRNY